LAQAAATVATGEEPAIEAPELGLPSGNVSRLFRRHPGGLGTLTLAEGWQAVGLYGVQSLLVLYMSGWLFADGHGGTVIGLAGFRALVERVTGPLSAAAFASQTMGLYLGVQFLTPLLGGWLGDRVIGPRLALLAGAAVMTLGLAALVTEPTFLIGLLLSTLGIGLFRSNLLALTGHLYARNDSRRDAAFSIIAMGLNVGAFLTPLIIGTLGERVGWRYGFMAAAAAMAVALVIIVVGLRGLPNAPVRHAEEPEGLPRLRAGDGAIIGWLFVAMAITATFWLAQAQVWNVYALWGRDHLDRMVMGFEVPVTWLQAIDSLAPIVAVPPVLWLWRRQAAKGREPDELGKIGIGCALIATAFLWLALGAGGKTPFLWVVVFHIVLNTGWLYVVPIANSLFARAAPPAVTALMIGVLQLSIFLGSTGAGWLGRFYETMAPRPFWLIHAAIPAAGAVVMALGAKRIARGLRL
jgi:POT family proton-dependent oligopeptide transporter